MIYGYIRVSTKGQLDGNSVEDQTNVIRERYGEARLIVESMSGAEQRPLFISLLENLQNGDTLVVTKLDRFCRTTKEGLIYIDALMSKGVYVHILNMGLIEDTPMGRLIVTNLLAFAEFERAMIKERTSAGKAIARQREGYREGRPPRELPDFKKIAKKQKDGLITVTEACKELNISRTQWYRMIKECA